MTYGKGVTIMFAILAAILFGVALVLDLADVKWDASTTLITAGLLCVAVHLALDTGPVLRRRP